MRRGLPAGQLAVGEYVGLAAAEAAQVVRRAGLRPALERSFDFEPALVGRVVAQDPPAGCEMARNAILTLYVAAPGVTPLDADHQPPVEACASSAGPQQAVAATNGTKRAEEHRARRRTPRPAARATRVLNASSAPVAPTLFVDPQATEERIFDGDVPVTEADAPRDEAPEDDGDGERPQDDLLVDVDEVFAGRTGVGWRRVYPPRRWLTTSGNQHPRRWSR